MKFLKLITLALLLTVTGAQASHIYTIGYDGSVYTADYSGDYNLEINDDLELTFVADTNGYWQDMTGSNFWSGILVDGAANRYGDYGWTYSLDGLAVAGGSITNDESMSVHVINLVTSFSGMFDQLTINYTLTASDTGDINQLGDTPFVFWSGTPFNATYVNNAAAVSAPGSALLALFGLLVVARNRARHTA